MCGMIKIKNCSWAISSLWHLELVGKQLPGVRLRGAAGIRTSTINKAGAIAHLETRCWRLTDENQEDSELMTTYAGVLRSIWYFLESCLEFTVI